MPNILFAEGSFKNYVDKMRWVGGQKMLLFVEFRVKNVQVEVGSQKGSKLCPRSF